MDRIQKASELIERAEKRGLRLEFDSSLILVKRTESGDPEKQDAIIVELGKYLSDVRRLVERRAIGARANEFIGERIWSADGEGVLAGASRDGALTITIVEEGFRHPRTVTAGVEGLLFVLDEEEADGASSAQDDVPKPEKPRRGIFGLLRGTLSDSKISPDAKGKMSTSSERADNSKEPESF